MNYEKLTQKSAECLRASQSLAVEKGNQQITSLHILSSLISDPDGIIYQILNDLNINFDYLKRDLEQAINALPKISPINEAYFAPETDRMLNLAENIAKQMKDEYVSVEHLFLAMFEAGDNATKEILSRNKVNRNQFIKIISSKQ